MDSLKSIVVVAILLGVLYGIYQVINEDDSPVSPQAANLLLEFDDNDANSTSMKPEPNKDENGSDLNGNGINNRKSSGSMTGSTDSPPPSNFVPVQTELANSGKRSANSKNNFEPKSPGIQTKPSPSGIPPEGKSMTTHRGIYRPGVDNEPKSGNRNQIIQTVAESNSNDPRSRFVVGSFAKFEKQVLSDMELAEKLIKKDDFVSALKTLSKFFDDPRLTPEETQNLVSWLDPLAGKVIYSVEHHLLAPYYVRQNDTLNLLSVKFGVPAELIFNINRVAIPDPQNLVPGTELKMVKGPFNAEISISKKKMTLFVNRLYAGTFSIRIGDEPVAKPGKYRVLSKSRLGQDYSDRNYQRIAAQAPNNPYGSYYLSLGGGMAIHGSAQVSDSSDRRGCISLNAVDSEDVHNILTTESTVTIIE